jgi:phenylalanyl-tRNA synthetase beta chain
MNISWKWLNELIDLQQNQPEEIANALTLSGFEVENIIKKSNGDTIFNINIPANRNDTTSVIGITREISTLIKQPIRRINNEANLHIKFNKIKNHYINYKNYLYGYLTNIKIQDSPLWLRNKLKLYGQKSENNLVDIINLLSIKWGQHLEIFDLDKIINNKNIKIDTKYNYKNKIFIDKNQNEIVLNTSSTIPIINNNPTLSLGEIDSSLISNISRKTSNIILQASVLNKIAIKQITKELKFDSEYSIKQSKSIYSTDLLNAYSEAILLIKYLCAGEVQYTYYLTNPQTEFKPFIIKDKYINSILGSITDKSNNIKNYNKNQIIQRTNTISILNHLNCLVYNKVQHLEIYIPVYRSMNIVREIDLIEEIGRIYGFNSLINPLPDNDSKGTISQKKSKINQIRYILRTIGLSEAIHYSLTKTKRNHLKIYNPLNEEHKYLRHNIINNLIDANLHNIKQGNEAINIFEIGKVFNNSNANYLEDIHIAGLMGGKEEYRSVWSDQPKTLTWFQAKGNLEEFFERIQINIKWNTPKINDTLHDQTKQFFHSNRLASLVINKKSVGIFGQLDLKLCKKLNFSKNTYGFEIKLLDLISSEKKNTKQFEPYSKYPYITRDIGITFPNTIEIHTLLEEIKTKISQVIESIQPFDYYTNNKNNQKITHIGLRIKYRSKIHTLTNDIVDNINEDTKSLIEKYITKHSIS